MGKKELQRNYQNNELEDLNKNFSNVFSNFFSKKGYLILPPTSLISQEDKTVIFTGSSTNIMKPFIVSKDFGEGNGFGVSQNCLRTQALKHAFDDTWLPFGQAYFHLSSTVSKPKRLLEVVNEFEEFTIDKLGVNPSDILIKSTKIFPGLDKMHTLTHLKIEYDTELKDYYSWKYGIPDINGEGITLCIKNKSTETYWDVGNIVRFMDDNQNERGIEFGYGHEFFLSAKFGIKNPLELSQVFEIFPFKEGISSKYYGYLEVVGRIKKEKENVRFNRSAKRTYNKYLHALKHNGSLIGKDNCAILNDLEKFCGHISSPTNLEYEEKIINGNKIAII